MTLGLDRGPQICASWFLMFSLVAGRFIPDGSPYDFQGCSSGFIPVEGLGALDTPLRKRLGKGEVPGDIFDCGGTLFHIEDIVVFRRVRAQFGQRRRSRGYNRDTDGEGLQYGDGAILPDGGEEEAPGPAIGSDELIAGQTRPQGDRIFLAEILNQLDHFFVVAVIERDALY